MDKSTPSSSNSVLSVVPFGWETIPRIADILGVAIAGSLLRSPVPLTSCGLCFLGALRGLFLVFYAEGCWMVPPFGDSLFSIIVYGYTPSALAVGKPFLYLLLSPTNRLSLFVTQIYSLRS